MINCRATTQSNTKCSRASLKSGFCFQHDKDEKIRMYRKELSKMHQRVRRYIEISNDLKSKLDDIQKIDFIKHKLIAMCPDRPYRAVLDNIFFKDEIEKLFDMSMTESMDEYNRLLERRNHLVHPYTRERWRK